MLYKRKNIIGLLIIIFSLSILGCKKSPLDYRIKFIGNYNFIVHNSSWFMGPPPLGGEKDTTFTNNGRVTLGSTDSTVLIYFFAGVSIEYPVEFTIYDDGTIESSSNFIGEFESVKKVRFNGGYEYLSGHDYYDVIGLKSK